MALASAALLTAFAPIASAEPSEGSAYNRSSFYSTSYFGLSNVCAQINTKIIADDRGDYVRINTGSYASFRIYNCATGATRTDITGRLVWNVRVDGWSVDGCGIQIPAGFSCSVATGTQVVSESWDMRGSYVRTISTGESFKFPDTWPGDISSATSTVQLVVNGRGLTASVKVAAP